MAVLLISRTRVGCWFLALAIPLAVFGQSDYVPQGGEYAAAGVLAGDQVFPDVAVRTSGGFVVWQDNFTDGVGAGVSALRLDSSLSATWSSFRVNQQGAGDQGRPRVALLPDGGAVFVWQGGRQGFQHIYARFYSLSNGFSSGDIMANATTNHFQVQPAVATLKEGGVWVVWGSMNQVASGSLQDVYAQRFSAAGQKEGVEFRINQFSSFNQRTPALAPLSDGRVVIVWVSEQQRFERSVDVYARIYDASGVAAGNEFMINTGTNVCASPSVAPSQDGGFTVAWIEKDVVNRSNSWDVVARPFTATGVGGVARRVNTTAFGDQLSPRISANGADYLVVWTSMGQDGSREGVYGQFLRADGTLAGGEFRVNTTTVSQQMQPAVASDGAGRFVALWTSFVGGAGSFDLYAQRYATAAQPLPQMDPPFVTVLSSNKLSVSWPALAGFNVASYEVYADGAEPPLAATAMVTNTYWTMSGLAPNSTHSFKVAYVLADGRRSPLSGATTNTTYGPIAYSGIPVEWMAYYFPDIWPPAYADSDGDGVSNRDEFLAGTDPTNPNSVLRIRLERRPQGLYLSWNTERGLVYQVQTSVNFGPWTNVGGPRFAAWTTDSMFVGGGNTGFYRIIRLR